MQDLIEINENVKLPKKCDRCSLDEFVQILPIVQTRNTWIRLSSKRFFRWSVNLFPIYILYRIPSRALNSFSPRGSRFPSCEESRWKFEEISRLENLARKGKELKERLKKGFGDDYRITCPVILREKNNFHRVDSISPFADFPRSKDGQALSI